jgi:GDP-L-fucose synthase
MRVLVTGAHGFLGQHLRGALQQRNHTVLGPSRAELELGDRSAVQGWFRTNRPDACIHAAAAGGGIGWMKEHPETALIGNVLATTHVLEAATDLGIPVVGVSSACVYPRDCAQPMREADIYAGAPEPTNGPYGHAKRLMLVQAEAAAAERGLRCAMVVPTNLYGPFDHFDPARSHIVAALIRRFEEARIAQLPSVTCWGSGRATRDLLYAADAAEAILSALERLPGPAPINLGTGVEHTTAQIATAVAESVGYEGQIFWDSTRPDGMPRKVLDSQLAQEKLAWNARTSLEDGLRETVRWYRSSS